ncbi:MULTISPECIES: putative bifunctional diguanylate cyclase/phosphodiesterase [unclassified Sphingobium]|uniref:putative bifunctional diguanylate cyclase/phosphodiesterase n=1 Tax=unclassified Sphingobium TaxID=2611147 RepID=UPI00222496A8|nr:MULTISPECIES: bifunctional diguanylate cyclase/phosphodiesterase [unclassified Sphingobium]MCW2380848.1 diguanylate cyclase (GGDEF)-like protein [Sphingobium sp. B2D3B]
MSLIQRVPARYLWPVLLLLGLCFGSILGLILVTTSAQDRLEAVRETRTLEAALATSVSMVEHDLQDYAKWDDAVRHISSDFSAVWIDDNITAYLGKTQNYDHVFVIGPDGETRYAFSNGNRSSSKLAEILGPSIQTAMAKVRAMDDRGTPIVSGFAREKRQVFVYSVAAVVPLTNKVSAPVGERHLLVIAERFDASHLASIRGKHHLPALALNLARPAPSSAALALRDMDGNQIASVEVAFETPGTQFRREVIPGFAGIMVVAVIAALFILRQGGQSIAALTASQARTQHLANHDPLTELPNRRVLLGRLNEAIATGNHFVLLYMDLDGFKGVNDLYGHGAGDALLREVASRLAAAAPAHSLIARTGGDEFAILCQLDVDGPGCSLAERIIASFQTTVPVAGANILIGISVGVVTSSSDALVDIDELMRRADVAMYNAKARGKNRWSDFTLELDEEHLVRKRLEQDLRIAIAENRIELAYQPIVLAESGAIVGLEALARWTHPTEGPIPPDVFIPLAEMTGLIGSLGGQVLRRACIDIKPLGIDLSVNLSPAQFWDAHLADQISAILADTGFPADRLELEITESYLLGRPQAAAAIMADLRTLGIRLALDDFGTGFASIGYLQSFKFDRLKIDKLFVKEAMGCASGRDLLVAIVALAQALGLRITAEGVETEDQAALARAAGCHWLQGWLFGRPMPLSQLLQESSLRRGTQKR